MPVRKRQRKNCYKVEGVKTDKCLTKKEAEKQLKAIKARQNRRGK